MKKIYKAWQFVATLLAPAGVITLSVAHADQLDSRGWGLSVFFLFLTGTLTAVAWKDFKDDEE